MDFSAASRPHENDSSYSVADLGFFLEWVDCGNPRGSGLTGKFYAFVSSINGVWGRVPAGIEFGAFLP